MLPPLKVSNDLLRRADDQRAQAAQAAEVDLSSAPPPPPEAIGALFSKTFGALDAALTMQELNCRTRGLGDHEIRTLLFVLRGGGGPLGTLGSTLPASSSCIGSLRKLDLSSNYLTKGCAQVSTPGLAPHGTSMAIPLSPSGADGSPPLTTDDPPPLTPYTRAYAHACWRTPAQMIAAILSEASQLEVLDLSGASWGDAALTSFCSAMRRAGGHALRSVTLCRSDIGEAGMGALATVRHGPCVEPGAPFAPRPRLSADRASW